MDFFYFHKILNVLCTLYKLNKLNYIEKFIIDICYNKQQF